MTLSALKASRALWKRRESYRYKKWRGYVKTKPEGHALRSKWFRLYKEAAGLVDRRDAQIRAKSKKPVRQRAVEYALSFDGKVKETPANSNKGGRITVWQERLGSWLVGQAWCGVFCGNMLLHVGVKGVDYRIASVYYIEQDAKRKLAPYRGWTTDPKKVLRGDLVVLFGSGVHVGMVVKVEGNYVHTIEGNTSSGNSGSQSNGGGVYARKRPLSDVYGFALVDYPG